MGQVHGRLTMDEGASLAALEWETILEVASPVVLTHAQRLPGLKVRAHGPSGIHSWSIRCSCDGCAVPRTH